MFGVQYESGGGGGEWLGGEDDPLEGFSWRGGSERDTTGILMWSQIFKATLDDGEKVSARHGVSAKSNLSTVIFPRHKAVANLRLTQKRCLLIEQLFEKFDLILFKKLYLNL